MVPDPTIAAGDPRHGPASRRDASVPGDVGDSAKRPPDEMRATRGRSDRARCAPPTWRTP